MSIHRGNLLPVYVPQWLCCSRLWSVNHNGGTKPFDFFNTLKDLGLTVQNSFVYKKKEEKRKSQKYVALDHEEHFVNEHLESKWTENNIIEILGFLFHNIFVVYCEVFSR